MLETVSLTARHRRPQSQANIVQFLGIIFDKRSRSARLKALVSDDPKQFFFLFIQYI